MAQGKHDGKPGKRRALLIVEIICVIVVIACVALIFMQVSKYWTANNEFNAITEEYDRNPNALVTDNPNCVGWVSVADTRIDYPVMYTPNDPEYYLHRNFEGNESAAGTPFLGKGCLLDGNSAIIYGHNMNDGSMFADIAGYTQETYWREHPIIQCDSLTRQREYEVMAVLQFKDSEQAAQDYYSVPCDEMNFTEYISRLADAALYDTGIQAVWGDQILALSTCSRQDSDSRILVIARKTGL